MKLENNYLTEKFVFWKTTAGWYMDYGEIPIKLTKKQAKDLKLEEWNKTLKGK